MKTCTLYSNRAVTFGIFETCMHTYTPRNFMIFDLGVCPTGHMCVAIWFLEFALSTGCVSVYLLLQNIMLNEWLNNS